MPSGRATSRKEVLHVWWSYNDEDQREHGTSFPNTEVGNIQATSLIESLKWAPEVRQIKLELWRINPDLTSTGEAVRTLVRRDSGWEEVKVGAG